MEMFDTKDCFNKKIEELSEQIKKLNSLNEEKTKEINQLNDKNHTITNLQKKIENELKSITDKLRNIEIEFNHKTALWRKSKYNLQNIIDNNITFFNNNYPMREYNNLNTSFGSSNNLNSLSYLKKIIFEKNKKNKYSNLSYKNNNYDNINTDNPQEKLKKILNVLNKNKEIENFNFLNSDYLFKCFDKYSLQMRLFSSMINNFNSNLIYHLDNFIESLIEHVNFLYTNIELKNEHRGYLYPLDKLKSHLFCVQQIIRTISFFIKILIKKIENLFSNKSHNIYSNNFNNTNNGYINNNFFQISANLNIVLFLINKSIIYTDLIGRYFSVMLKEERKIVNIDADNDFFLNRSKINKNLKIMSNSFFHNLKIITKYLNFIFNFDLNYHFKHFKITSDNSAMIIITVCEYYMRNLSFNNFAKAAEGIILLNKLIFNDFSKNFKINLQELIKQFELKLELEYKMFEIIKEENKHKYNYPIINLSSLRLNNDNIKKSLKEISLFFTQDLFTQIIQVFKINSWEYGKCNINNNFHNDYLDNSNKFLSLIQDGDIIISIFSNRIINYLTLYQMHQKSNIKTYLASEPGIDYEEGIRNKNILRGMLEKENKSVKDKENYVIKLSEYEEDLKKLREQVTIQQNELDICNLKLFEGKNIGKPINENYNNININNNKINTTKDNIYEIHNNSETDILSPNMIELKNDSSECSLIEQIKYAVNLNEIPKEILSDDVQSGKQRSTFKLSDKNNKPIPLTKFITKSDNITGDLSVIYHRKILDKIQKYTAKIKNIDVKVIANIQSDDIKREYDEKIVIFKEGYITEINELQEKLHCVELSNLGYKENIEFLTNIMVDFEGLKECVARCANCNKFIKMLENRK